MNVLKFLKDLLIQGAEIRLVDNKLKLNAPPDKLDNLQLEKLKQEKNKIIEVFTRLGISSNKDYEYLSFAQQRLWVLDQIDSGSRHYNIANALKLSGSLDYQALNKAFTTIVCRHESLRTFFVVDQDNEPIQVVRHNFEFHVDVQDLFIQKDPICQLKISNFIDEETNRIFDLSCDLMLRASLLKIAADEHILIVTLHHIASDGWSMSILIKEFTILYESYLQGHANPLAPLEIQYADYAYWQRNSFQGEDMDRQLGYWDKQLADLPVIHSLPLDKVRPLKQNFMGDTYISHVGSEHHHALTQFCKLHDATLFMGLHAVFSVLLSRYSNETDIVIGCPIANREQLEIAELIGFFANVLVLRSNLSKGTSFTELLQRSKDTLLDAYAHQQIPFEKIVERLQPVRSLSYNSIFQIMLVLQNNEQVALKLPELILEPLDHGSNGSAKYDLTLDVRETEKGLLIRWEYNTELFEMSTISRMAEHFGVLLNTLLEQPNESVFKVDVLNTSERHQILVDWNSTTVDYPKQKCIHELIEIQVQKNPTAIAVIFEGEQLTYQQLNEKSNQLSHYLVSKRQVIPDSLVGICLERSLDMVIGILAILKAGGAYVPLDPNYPKARLAYMFEDAKLTTVITHSNFREMISLTKNQAIYLDNDEFKQQLKEQPIINPSAHEQGLISKNLAYVIYTSGSTGNPKGVMVEHQALVNRIDWMNRKYGSSSSDRILQKTPFSFDVSVWEFMWPLSVGAGIVVAKPEGHKDPIYLSSLIQREQITKLHFVPSMLSSILSAGDLSKCISLKQVFCSGEALALHHVDEFKALYPWVELHNLYGPTEAAIDVSYWNCSRPHINAGSVPIGSPISNIQLYVLNHELVPTPQNVTGELFIGGVGLARGYLNRPDLTAETFISNQYYDENNQASSKYIYKTGDLVRWLPDGILEFQGRIDHQVKVRGFRIELGEIENTLRMHEYIKDAIVLAKTLPNTSDKHLVAYVMTDKEDNSELTEHLRHHINQHLPDYMMPSAFVALAQLPLTSNGKVDRKALPEPDYAGKIDFHIAPTSETEITIARIWGEMFSIDEKRIDANTSFFNIGGDSLSVIKFKALAEKYGLFFSLQEIIQNQTIAQMAAIENLKDRVRNEDFNQKERKSTFPLLPEQKWFFSENYENSNHFNISSILEVDLHLDFGIAKLALKKVISIHEALSSVFKNGMGEISTEEKSIDDVPFYFFDFSETSETILNEKVEEICRNSQKNFNLQVGPLFCVNYFNLGAHRTPLFFFAFHHLIVDHLSLEIFFEDFKEEYLRIFNNDNNNSSDKSYSFVDICDFVDEVAKDKNRLDYWKSQPWNEYSGYRTDYAVQKNENNVLSTKIVRGSLTKRETDLLLATVVTKWKFSLVDALYYCLARALRIVNDGEVIPVWNVASGRTFISMNSALDLSRAIGWFSMPSPRFITKIEDVSIYDEIRFLSNYFNSIVDAGCSYLPCAYSSLSQEIPMFPDEDKVVFNHLGFSSYGEKNNSLPNIEIPENPSNYRSCLFKCVTIINGGELQIRWEYSENQFSEFTIQRMVDLFIASAKSICEFSLENEYEHSI